jgi:tetratricopeptide (TPR) repeat protein
MFELDIEGGGEAFRTALTLARESQSLDLAAIASANLGVICMRGGDFEAAHDALHDALRFNTTLRNHPNRLIALYNIANLENERGDTQSARRLYREAVTRAAQLGTDDIGIGAQAGIGLASLRLSEVPAAVEALRGAEELLGTRHDWWFQGRELLESLAIRLHADSGQHVEAVARFHGAVERLEALDVYAAAWLVADCAATLAERDGSVWPTVERMSMHPTVQLFMPLAARFTALRDMAERRPAKRFSGAGPAD